MMNGACITGSPPRQRRLQSGQNIVMAVQVLEGFLAASRIIEKLALWVAQRIVQTNDVLRRDTHADS